MKETSWGNMESVVCVSSLQIRISFFRIRCLAKAVSARIE